ncbi:hypothetical protein [Azospirillum isscasi]|uniref:Lipoprotein n=1 Tax=Azospirillum isscasi TaxID=3053926 RepID=A0ABU0WJD3_9PROT|nr:hypothetical protein [Azospirillum isscasi]MDQ2103699.1 hypothetical protein [Azospirillum isscasi]
MTVIRRTAGLMALLLVTPLLAGCNEEEQARPIHLEKGVYRGAADTQLSADQTRALQQRSAGQRF